MVAARRGVTLAQKISVYVDEDLHRALKAEAARRGISLSDFMLQAARWVLYSPGRLAASEQLDRVRDSVKGTYGADDISALRQEGRRG
jgi:hypothetical protein